MRTSLPIDIPEKLVQLQQPVRGIAAASWYLHLFSDPIACICKTRHKYGNFIAFGSPLQGTKRERLHAVALGPDLNRMVFSQPDLFRTTGQTIAGPLGSAHRRIRFGLTAMNGPLHQEQRRLVLPCFQGSAVHRYHPGIVTIAEAMIRDWKVDETLDIWEKMRSLTLRISSAILFGQNQSILAEQISGLIHTWLSQSNALLVRAFPLNFPGSPYRSMLKTAARLEQKILEMVELKKSTAEHDTDLLAQLIRGQQSGKTQPHLVGQTTILFGASYETMLNALTWTLFLLAQHPPVMSDLLDELTGKLHGESPTSEQLGQLSLLDAVIKESMRILPPVPYTIRGVTRPVEMGFLQLNKSDRVICSHYVTHHLPELFPDPESFNPYRWSGITPGPYDYLPFSAGPRSCIGAGFAMTVMKVVLAIALQRFRFSVVPNTRIDRLVHVTMRPKFGMPMILHRQDRLFQAAQVEGNIHEMVRLPTVS